MVVGAIVAGTVLSLVLSHHRHGHEPAAAAVATDTPTAAPTPCTPLKEPYGSPPGNFVYKKAPESQRARTVKALNLSAADGKIDMRLAQQGGITLGSIVGVPSRDPGAVVDRLVSTVRNGGGSVTQGDGYVLIPLANGQSVAAGPKGCRAVLIASQDPNGLKYLAASIFSG